MDIMEHQALPNSFSPFKMIADRSAPHFILNVLLAYYGTVSQEA